MIDIDLSLLSFILCFDVIIHKCQTTYLWEGAENLRGHLEGALLFSIIHNLCSHWGVVLGDECTVKTMALSAQLRSVEPETLLNNIQETLREYS